MAQFFFFSLLIITLLAGFFAYFAPSQKPVNPLQFVMDSSGYSSEVKLNHTKSKQFNVIANNGLIQVRKQIDDLAQAQTKYFDTIQEQQQMLKNAGKEVSDVMLEAQQVGGKDNNDVLQLKALTSQMQDQQHFLVAHGNDLAVLNNQLIQNRQWMADQMEGTNINTDASTQMLQQRFDLLKSQSAGFFNQGDQYSQEIRNCMGKIQNQLSDLANNNAIQQQNIKDRIARMLEKEQDNMQRLADSEQRNRDLMDNVQQKLADSQEAINDSRQRTQDMLDDEHQKQEDQQGVSQQRTADLMQRLQDQQNR